MEESKQTSANKDETEAQPLKVVPDAGPDNVKSNGTAKSPPEKLPEIKLYGEDIYPSKKRPKSINWFIMWWYFISFQCTWRLLKAHITISAAEVQTRRMVKERMEMADTVNQLEHQQQRSGLHLSSEVFIPQYAGAKQRKIDNGKEPDDIYYELGDLRLIKHKGATWLISNAKTGGKSLVELDNLYIGVIVLQAMGADISFDSIMEDNPAMKQLQEKLGRPIELG